MPPRRILLSLSPPSRATCSFFANGFSCAVANRPKPSASKSVRAATPLRGAFLREELRPLLCSWKNFGTAKQARSWIHPTQVEMRRSTSVELERRQAGQTILSRGENFQLLSRGFQSVGGKEMCQKRAPACQTPRDQRALWSVARVRVTVQRRRSPVRSFRISSSCLVGNVREQSTMRRGR